MGEELLAHRSNHRAHVWTVPAHNESAVSRNQIHESTKGQLHGRKIVVNIRVVKFDIVYDADLRQVMHELGTLVEISSVVFVAFDDEVVAGCHPKADTEILRDAANQETWIKASLVH